MSIARLSAARGKSSSRGDPGIHDDGSESVMSLSKRRQQRGRLASKIYTAKSIFSSKLGIKSKRMKSLPDEKGNGFKNNEGYTLKRPQRLASKKWQRMKSTTANIFGNVKDVFSDNKKDAKSTVSGQNQMDPETRAAYRGLKSNHIPSDLSGAADIVDTLRSFPLSPEIQHTGLSYLAPIALQESVGLLKNGALEVILKAFENFPENGRVLEAACVLVWNLATEDSNKEEMAKQKICEKIVGVLQSYKRKEGAFKNAKRRGTIASNSSSSGTGFGTLLHMACGATKVLATNEQCKRILVDLGAIELVMAAFTFICSDAPNDPDPQVTCIGCIQNFCNGTKLEEYCDKVFKALGPLIVIRSMLKFPDNLEIQMAGCAAIWNMCLEVRQEQTSQEDINEVVDDDAAEENENTLEEEDKEEEPDDKRINILVKNKPHKPVSKLEGPERRKQLVEAGAGTRVVAALKEWKEDSRVVTRALGALKALVLNDQDLLHIVRSKIHQQSAGTKDLGVVNIYDVLFEAYAKFEEEDDNIRKFGEELLFTFEIEDNENTNREKIERMKEQSDMHNTLQRHIKNSSKHKSLREVELPNRRQSSDVRRTIGSRQPSEHPTGSSQRREVNHQGHALSLFEKDLDIHEADDLGKEFAATIRGNKTIKEMTAGVEEEDEEDDEFANVKEIGEGEEEDDDSDFEL